MNSIRPSPEVVRHMYDHAATTIRHLEDDLNSEKLLHEVTQRTMETMNLRIIDLQQELNSQKAWTVILMFFGFGIGATIAAAVCAVCR